jgi:hypothetical protein
MMTSRELDALARIGTLKAEAPSRAEYDGLVSLGEARITDARRKDLAPASRFDLAYNASHALALAALRRVGFRAGNRRVVFEALAHTTALSEEARRVLIKCHERRNFAEYEGLADVDERLLDDLIRAAGELRGAVRQLAPPNPET